jgi:major membrane immunogen (membrane-anchored lipoprotein)
MAYERSTYTDHGTIRSAAILTNSYVAATTIGIQGNGGTKSLKESVSEQGQLQLYVDFTKGSLTSGEIKVEFSADNTNWYQETTISISGGTQTMTVAEYTTTAGGAFRLEVPIKDKFIRVSAKGTGTVTSSSMTIKAITGIV